MATKAFNQQLKGLRKSATLAINERMQELIQAGQEVYKLGFGQSPFPVPAPVVEALKANAHQKDYLPVKGLHALRATIAQYWKRVQGLEYTAEDIMISPGSKELLFLIQLVYDGDLLIPSPSWVSYAPQATIVGKHIHWLETKPANNWCLQADELDAFCTANPGRPKIVILNYPSNPTGATCSRSELAAMAAIARKHGVLLVSDEIYGELHHDGQHTSIAHYYPEGTIISSGLSKWCGAGGWRLGMFTFPENLRWLLDAIAVVASETYTTTSAPIQYAAIQAYQEHPAIESQLYHSRRILKAIGGYVHDRLKSIQVSMPFPEGGFYLFPNFERYKEQMLKRGIHHSAALCEQLLTDTGVALLPSFDFGRPSQELTARLSYVDFDGGKALEVAANEYDNVSLDDAYLRKCCPKIIEAMDRIEAWI
jgi:aspartate aminotransferase